MDNHNTFLPRLINEILLNSTNYYSNNYDYNRFGKKYFSLRKLISSLANKIGFINLNNLKNTLETILTNLSYFEKLFSYLGDIESKEILLKLLAYRCLGYRKIKLPLNNPEYWSNLKELKKLEDKSDFIKTEFMGIKLFKTDLKNINLSIKGYFNSISIYSTFVIQQYRGIMNKKTIEVESGDSVIDAGACWGETSLYFSYKAGRSGKVYSFEFVPQNIEIFNRSINLNPELKSRIKLISNAVWDSSNLKIYFKDNGPGSKVSMENFKNATDCSSTLSIDDLVKRESLDKVDFIKMDIEGAELRALKGSINTLKSFQPKLAISIYHNLHDFYLIPEFIDSLGLGYKYIIRHFTIHAEETVLFAWVD